MVFRVYPFLDFDPLQIKKEDFFEEKPVSYMATAYPLYRSKEKLIKYSLQTDDSLMFFYNKNRDSFDNMVSVFCRVNLSHRVKSKIIVWDFEETIEEAKWCDVHRYRETFDHFLLSYLKFIQDKRKQGLNGRPILNFIHLSESHLKELQNPATLKRFSYLISKGSKDGIFFVIGAPTVENVPEQLMSSVKTAVFIGAQNTRLSAKLYPKSTVGKKSEKKETIGVMYKGVYNKFLPIDSKDKSSDIFIVYEETINNTMNSYKSYLDSLPDS